MSWFINLAIGVGIIVLCGGLVACNEDSPPEQGPRAWLDIRVESSDVAAVLADVVAMDVVVHPLQPLVDATGVPYLEGPVPGTDLEFIAAIAGGLDRNQAGDEFIALHLQHCRAAGRHPKASGQLVHAKAQQPILFQKRKPCFA